MFRVSTDIQPRVLETVQYLDRSVGDWRTNVVPLESPRFNVHQHFRECPRKKHVSETLRGRTLLWRSWSRVAPGGVFPHKRQSVKELHAGAIRNCSSWFDRTEYDVRREFYTDFDVGTRAIGAQKEQCKRGG